jgi:hypothetical protein
LVYNKIAEIFGLNCIFLEYINQPQKFRYGTLPGKNNIDIKKRLSFPYRFSSVSMVDILLENFSKFSFIKYNNPFMVINNSSLIKRDEAIEFFKVDPGMISDDITYLIPNALERDNNYFLCLNSGGLIDINNTQRAQGKLKKGYRFGENFDFDFWGNKLSYKIFALVYAIFPDNIVHFDSNFDIVSKEYLVLTFEYVTEQAPLEEHRLFQNRKIGEKIKKINYYKFPGSERGELGDFGSEKYGLNPNKIDKSFFSYQTSRGFPILMFYFSPSLINSI